MPGFEGEIETCALGARAVRTLRFCAMALLAVHEEIAPTLVLSAPARSLCCLGLADWMSATASPAPGAATGKAEAS